MKIIMLVICLIVFAPLFVCQASDFSPKPETCKFLSEADAEKIVDQAVVLIENTYKTESGVRNSFCTYRGVSKDTFSGKGINLYFSLAQPEQNPKIELAQQEFESAYEAANEPDILVYRLSELGDDAFVISNPPHFHFIMVRKGAVIFRMKLNKAPGETSLEEIKAFAKNLAEKF